MSTTIIPLKIYFPKRGFQIGVAAKSLQHLRDTLQAKMGLSNTFKLTLDDGTIVCDPEYFKLLERQTKLNVIELSKTTTNATEESADAARKRMSPTTPPAANKRPRLSSAESRDKTDLNTNQNNSQLLSRICISSVAGNVPMSESPPKPASEHSRLSPAVQQQKPVQSPVPQAQVQTILPLPSQCTQTIRSPPPAQQVQNSQLSLQHVHRKPAATPRVIMLPQQHPQQIQQSIPSPLILQQQHQRPVQAPPFPQQIVIPSNQPHVFPGQPPTPLTAPPMMTPTTIQWIPQGATGRYPHSLPPQYPPGSRIVYPHQVPPPHPDMLAYQPRPRPPQSPQQLMSPQEHIYQMQVERQMKTMIRMTPPPFPSQTPLPQPVQPQIRPTPVVPQIRPMAVIQSRAGGPRYPVIQQAQPPTPLPDGVQQMVELLQAPEPTLIPSTPPALLKVISSKLSPDSRRTFTSTSTTDSSNSNSADAAGLFSSPTRVSEPANLQGRHVTPAEDTDCEDEHALQIVVGESENLPQSTTPPPPPTPAASSPAPRLSSSPCALSSPLSRASSTSPCSPPVVAAGAQKSRKPADLKFLPSQIDDGYCSATTSSLGSADDVKRALPFASFDDCIPLHSCYTDSKDDQDNHAIVSTVPQDKCAITNPPQDGSTGGHQQQDTTPPSGDEALTVEIPVKVIDGQIYYDHIEVKEEPDLRRQEPDMARQEIIFLDSEAEDHDSDVNPLEQFINQGTPSSSFHLSLDEEDVSEMDTDVENDRSVESKGDICDEKQVVVADHGGEVPVVTTPLDRTIAFDLNKCVADLMDVVCSKDKQNDDSPCNLESQNQSATCHFDGEATCMIEESVLIDSSNLHDEGLLSDELVMGNEVVVSLEGSSQPSLDYLDSSELISNLLLHSCLPQNGRRVSLS